MTSRAEHEVAVDLRWGAATHRGVRRTLNEDGHHAGGRAFVVADGMGGHDAGDVASRLVVETLAPLAAGLRDDDGSGASQEVARLIDAAHDRLRGVSTRPGRGAGATVTGAVVVEQAGVPYWLVFNVGDSRTYLLVAGRLEQVSVDHSEVQDLLEAGTIDAAEARTHPRRHVVTRALGPGGRPRADFWYLPVGVADRALMCSDGLTGEVDDERIAEVLRSEPDSQAAADVLVAEALRAGGRDNITVVVVDASAAAADEDGERTAPRPVSPAVLVGTDDEDTLPRAGFVLGGQE